MVLFIFIAKELPGRKPAIYFVVNLLSHIGARQHEVVQSIGNGHFGNMVAYTATIASYMLYIEYGIALLIEGSPLIAR